MYKLGRQVRFSINPFLSADSLGFNPYASRPAGEGLAVFLELSVALAGEVEPATGFVVNVIDIDRAVRKFAVPIFTGQIREYFRQGKHIDIPGIAELLRLAWDRLNDKFGPAKLSKLSLKLNPFRKVAIDCADRREGGMIYFSEKFEFSATHKLWSDEFSNERNFEAFGRCASPAGHGHNYIVEVTVKTSAGRPSFCISDFERTVNSNLLKLLDHKNLNTDVAHFSKTNPTVENISAFAWNKLAGKFGQASLHCVTVWETDRTYCSYYG